MDTGGIESTDHVIGNGAGSAGIDGRGCLGLRRDRPDGGTTFATGNQEI